MIENDIPQTINAFNNEQFIEFIHSSDKSSPTLCGKYFLRLD